MTRNFFLRKYLAYYKYKPIPVEERFKKNLKLSFFRALKCSYFALSVPWTGNELAGDDVET